MFITAEFVNHYWAFIIFVLGTFTLCFFMLTLGFFLGGRAQSRSKNLPFESGINPVITARLGISAKFYLVAVFFVIFDVEAIYLYSWAIVIRETGWTGFIEATIFIFILLLSLIYLVRTGALDWTPDRSKRFNRI